MKQINVYIYYAIMTILCFGMMSSCDDPTEQWEEINAIIPANNSYSISIKEVVDKDSDTGVYSVNTESVKYMIEFTDADGVSLGHIDFIGGKGLSNLSGSYQSLSSTTFMIDDNPFYGEFAIQQNALNSISILVEGEEAVKLSKGVGVPEYTRPSDNKCNQKFLLSKSSNNDNGTYSYTLTIGSNGIDVEQGLIDVYSGTGEYLQIKFISSTEKLAVGRYNASNINDISCGKFSIGTQVDTEWFSYIDGSQHVSLVDGEYAAVKRVLGGMLDVSLSDEAKDIFNISGYLIDEDEEVYEINYTGSIVKDNNGANPSGNLTYTDEISDVTTFDMSTFQQTVIPGIKQHVVTVSDASKTVAACFTFITKDGATDYSGSYTVVESASAEGLMNNGYDFTDFGMGIGGSYWYDNGELILIQPGTIVSITDNSERILKFEGDGFSITATPEGYTPGNPDLDTIYTMTVEISDVYTPSFELVNGVKNHNITFYDAENKIAVFSLILPDNINTYNGIFNCVENASEAYQMINGFDMSMWGLGMGGSYWYKEGNLTLVNAGETLTVTLADDIYTFEGDGFSFNGKF